MDADATAATWKGLADSYENARTKPDSFDVLMEFPAQLELIGDVAGKRVLDLACGSGAKAITSEQPHRERRVPAASRSRSGVRPSPLTPTPS